MTQAGLLYQADTVYDEAAYTVLVHVMMKHIRRLPRFLVLVTGLISVVYSGYVIISTGQVAGFSLLFLLLGNLFMVFGLFAKQFAVRLMVAGNKKGQPPQNRYAFYEDRIQITTMDGEREYTYPYLRCVLDAQGYFILFFKDGQVFLLRHAAIGPEKSKGLFALLNQKLAENKEGHHAPR